MGDNFFREMANVKTRLLQLETLANGYEQPRLLIAMTKLDALLEDVALDLAEALTPVALEIVNEASRLANEIEFRLVQGISNETLH